MIEKYAEGCFRLKGVTPGHDDVVQILLEEALQSKLKRARLCMHESDQSLVQEMIVLCLKDSPKGTYKYKRASSKYLIRGVVDIAFFGLQSVTLDALQRYIRIPANVYHTPTFLTDFVVLHEIHQGPWTPDFTTRLTTRELEHMEAG